MGKRTIKDWIDNFPEPYRTMAFKNNEAVKHLKDGDNYPWDCLDEKCNSSIKALMLAFPWGKSVQGIHYWLEFADQLIKEKK